VLAVLLVVHQTQTPRAAQEVILYLVQTLLPVAVEVVLLVQMVVLVVAQVVVAHET
jgi:hypothetical protein